VSGTLDRKSECHSRKILTSEPKQLANLRPAGAVTHGTTSERKLAPLRDHHRGELMRRFPQLDEHRLSLLADLLARCELARDFIDVRGLMRNTREPHLVLELLSRWERRAWEMLGELRPVRQSVDPPERLDIPDIGDPEVGAATRTFFEAVNNARRRRLAGEKPMAAQ